MSDKWIEWNGGEMPVPGDTVVEVKFSGDQTEVERLKADSLDWRHKYTFANIIAYRIAQPAKYPACKGKNCGCTDGVSHSPDCHAEPTDAPKTLRDRFAMAALTGLCANQPHVMARLHATEAYEFADAMMEARKK